MGLCQTTFAQLKGSQGADNAPSGDISGGPPTTTRLSVCTTRERGCTVVGTSSALAQLPGEAIADGVTNGDIRCGCQTVAGLAAWALRASRYTLTVISPTSEQPKAVQSLTAATLGI